MENATTIVKRKITKRRVEVQQIKSTVDKLGEETMAILPDNLEEMYCGKVCLMLIKSRVAAENIMWSYIRQYSGLNEDQIKEIRNINGKAKLKEKLVELNCFIIYEKLMSLQEEYDLSFERFKSKVSKITAQNELFQRFSAIKGLSSYQFSILLSCIKDISRFDTSSKLNIYAGNGCVQAKDGKWVAVTKANINVIKQIYQEQGKEFKGFNTVLSGRLFVITECLLRQKGYFYNMYQKIRIRLEKRCIDSGEAKKYTKEQIAAMKKKDKTIKFTPDKYYMIGRKNYSLISFTDKNAKRRVQRTLLHLIWKEWRTMEGLPTRVPYPVDYLNHTGIITLNDVISYETNN